MSTPISRNSKLQGPALYAPPRVRERLFSGGHIAIAETQPETEPDTEPETEEWAEQQPEADQPETDQVEDDQSGTVETADFENEADDVDALDWVEDAIRAVIAIEHAADQAAASLPRVAAPQSRPVAPSEVGNDDEAPASSNPGPQDYGTRRNIKSRRLSLEPEIVPEPPPAMQQTSIFPLVIRFSAVIIFAAVVAYGLTMLSSSQLWIKGTSQRVAGNAPQPRQVQPDSRPPSRLIVADQQTLANEPLPLSLSVEHPMDNESLLVDGLAQGTTLSAGTSTSGSSWQLPYGKLSDLYLYAPKGFVGVMNAGVDLLGPDKRLLDSRTMQLKWVARQPDPASAPPVKIASAEATAGGHVGTAKPPTAAIETIDPSEAAFLMQKGRDSLSAGDISGARVAFRRLADAGIADAALALAKTYDPEYLSAHSFLGMQGNRATAGAWYQRAKDLGSAEAGQILARMIGN
ncbi:MAG TPA: hypothetical protein VMF12_06325 [Xanthobacteraceae bacterium]|nr:hypothetical protein [Xanthobacteraceae bacterium]